MDDEDFVIQLGTETRRSPNLRSLGSMLLGTLVFVAGLALALAWLPEWWAGRLPEEGRFVERYRELAARAGVLLTPGAPRVSLATSADDLALAGATEDRRGPRAVSPELAGVRVRVSQEGTFAGQKAFRTLAISFSPDTAPRMVEWTLAGLSGMFTPSVQYMSRAQAEIFLRLLLAPGESPGPPALETNGSVLLYPLPGSRRPQHVSLTFIPGDSVVVQRSPGTVEQAAAQGSHVNLGAILSSILPNVLEFLLVAGLFFFLASRGRIDIKNGLLLTGLTLLASLGGLFNTLPDGPSVVSTLVVLVTRALWVFLAWSAGESFIRSTSPEFTTSLDALRVGRLGPRGGRALLFGLALGSALAGLRLATASTALALPGIWPEKASLRLPIFDTASPVGDGIVLAAEALGLLALAGRFLPRRWVIPVAAFAGAFFISPVSLHPWVAGYAANFALLSLLFYGGRRYGLTALLTAAMTSFLLPAAAFAALHLDWLPWTFALTAGDPLALLYFGFLSMRRSEQVELERLAPPAFIRRLEEERRGSQALAVPDRLSEADATVSPGREIPSLPRNIFISYARKDKRWLETLRTMLKPLLGEGIELWDDTEIQPGTEWKLEIERALASAKVAVLLVTPTFLASEFILREELPYLLRREGLKILWVAVRESLYKETEIAKYQAVNDPSRPLSALRRPERDRQLRLICEVIKQAALS